MFDTFRSGITKIFKRKAPYAGEIAVGGSNIYGDLGFREYNPDVLVRTKGFSKTYDEMRNDDEVKASLTLKKHAVLAPGWEIEPASEDNIDVKIAAYVEYAADKMQGSIADFLIQAMSALDYGYSIAEIVPTIYEGGEFSGLIGLKALKSKRPHGFEFDTDQFSNLKPKGLIQTGFLGADEKPLPIEKFIIYSYQKEFGNWYGTSDLRACYRAWWSKDNIIKFWNIYLERFGSPLVVGKHKTSNPQAVRDLKTILKNLQNKTNITFRDGEFDIGLLEPQRKSTADYQAALAFYNKSIARAILLPDRLSSAGETGAYSQAKIHFDVFLWVIQKLRQDLEDTIMNEQLIRRMVGWNFQNVKKLPKFKFNPLTTEQRLALAEAFANAVQKGAVTVTHEDSNHIRRALDFPEQEEPEQEPDTEPIIPKAPKPQSPGPGKQGEDEDETGEGQKRSMAVTQRATTQYEKKVNFAKIDTYLNNTEQAALTDLRAVLTKQRDALTRFVASKYASDNLTSKLITSGIDLKYSRDIKATVQKMFVDTYQQGITDAKAELPKAFATAKQGRPMQPKKAIEYFTAKTDFVVAGIRGPLTMDIHTVLLSALRDGTSIPDIVKLLEDAYIPYLADGTAIIDSKQLTAYRLEAIARTNMSEAYNFGRRAVGEDPELEGYVVGYQFSEILDSRTARVSEFVDEKIISVKHPQLSALSYPLHWNERGMFVFVTEDEAPVTFMSDGEIAKAISMKRI